MLMKLCLQVSVMKHGSLNSESAALAHKLRMFFLLFLLIVSQFCHVACLLMTSILNPQFFCGGGGRFISYQIAALVFWSIQMPSHIYSQVLQNIELQKHRRQKSRIFFEKKAKVAVSAKNHERGDCSWASEVCWHVRTMWILCCTELQN